MAESSVFVNRPVMAIAGKGHYSFGLAGRLKRCSPFDLAVDREASPRFGLGKEPARQRGRAFRRSQDLVHM